MQNRTITPDFDNGNYYLRIHDGVNEKPEMQQIVVKH